VKPKSLNFLKSQNLVKTFILGSSLFVSLIILLVSQSSLKSFKKDFSKALIISSNGEIITPEIIKVEDIFLVEAKDHLKNFMDCFFSFDQFSFDSQLQKALSLGDHSIKLAYERLKKTHYDQIIEKSISQKVKWQNLSSEIEIGEQTQRGWFFQIKTLLEINISNEKTHDILQAKGFLTKVKRNPKNPHGLLISDFSFTKNSKDEVL